MTELTGTQMAIIAGWVTVAAGGLVVWLLYRASDILEMQDKRDEEDDDV